LPHQLAVELRFQPGDKTPACRAVGRCVAGADGAVIFVAQSDRVEPGQSGLMTISALPDLPDGRI
jgi:hypothetical protein